jgi:hypothetical protein
MKPEDEEIFKALKRGDYNANRVIAVPKQSKWKCEMFGTGPGGMVLCPMEGGEPNWFWRWMQYLILGNRWIYTEEEENPED